MVNVVKQIKDALAEIMPEQDVDKWLETPNPVFDNKTPIHLIKAGQAEHIIRMVEQIKSNVAN